MFISSHHISTNYFCKGGIQHLLTKPDFTVTGLFAALKDLKLETLEATGDVYDSRDETQGQSWMDVLSFSCQTTLLRLEEIWLRAFLRFLSATKKTF